MIFICVLCVNSINSLDSYSVNVIMFSKYRLLLAKVKKLVIDII